MDSFSVPSRKSNLFLWNNDSDSLFYNAYTNFTGSNKVLWSFRSVALRYTSSNFKITAFIVNLEFLTV